MHLTVVSSVCLKKFTWKQSTSGRSRSYTIIWVARQDLRHSTTFGGPRMLDRIIWVKLGWVVQGLLFVFFGGFQYPPLKQAWNEHLKHQPFLWIGQPVYSSCQSEWTKVDWISFQTLVTCHTHTQTHVTGERFPPPPNFSGFSDWWVFIWTTFNSHPYSPSSEWHLVWTVLRFVTLFRVWFLRFSSCLCPRWGHWRGSVATKTSKLSPKPQ